MGWTKPSKLEKLYDLIPPHRKRATLRKCFAQIDRIVSRPEATAGEILQALKALDLVLGLAAPRTPVDKLAEAILKPDDKPDAEFWKDFEKIMEERRKYVQ